MQHTKTCCTSNKLLQSPGLRIFLSEQVYAEWLWLQKLMLLYIKRKGLDLDLFSFERICSTGLVAQFYSGLWWFAV